VHFAPGTPWSLLDIMRTFDVSGFLSLASAMAKLGMPDNKNPVISSSDREAFSEKLSSYQEDLTDLGLAASRASVKKLIAQLCEPEATWNQVAPLCELRGRIVDETEETIFFSLSLQESGLYGKPLVGWQKGISRFPSIRDDVEEASKCLALSRYAAAIWHSTQIVEGALIELGKFIGVNDPTSGWTAVSNRLSIIIKTKYQDRSDFERSNYAFLEQVQGTVEGLKNAWRNKISHAEGRLFLM
jgi:hypothetical protein